MESKYNKIKTLIVDDDELLKKFLKKLAEGAGLKDIDVASSELEADYYLDQNKYQLLILDTFFGPYNLMGPSIAKKAYRLGQTPTIIALSGLNSEKPWGYQGFDYEFFDKGKFHKEDLVNILEKIVKK